MIVWKVAGSRPDAGCGGGMLPGGGGGGNTLRVRVSELM